MDKVEDGNGKKIREDGKKEDTRDFIQVTTREGHAIGWNSPDSLAEEGKHELRNKMKNILKRLMICINLRNADRLGKWTRGRGKGRGDVASWFLHTAEVEKEKITG